MTNTQLQLEPVQLGILIILDTNVKRLVVQIAMGHMFQAQGPIGNPNRKPLHLGLAPLLDSIQHKADVPAQRDEFSVKILVSNLRFLCILPVRLLNNC